jgi:putative heme iron utilization protein
MTTSNTKEIKLPDHLQALVDNPRVKKLWEEMMEEKKAKTIIEDVTPSGYGPDKD